MQKIFFPARGVWLLALFTSVTYAQTQEPSLTTYLPDDCYHSGDYRQSEIVSGLSRPLITTGSYVYDCRQGLIWHTQTPIVETIVYARSGDTLLITEHGERRQLESRVHRRIGELLNQLIGGNSGYIRKTFTLQPAANGFTLTPNNRRMKKFLSAVKLNNHSDGVTLTLQHPDNESTSVDISERVAHANLDEASCIAIATIPPTSCRALFNQ